MVIFFLLFSFQVFAADEIIKSKDEIVFRKPDAFMFSSIGKISEFRGIIERVSFTAFDLKIIDLYQFNTDALKVNKKLCMDLVEQIFSLSNSKLFELKSFQIVDSNKGKVCEAYVADKAKVKKTKEEKNEAYHRFVSLGFINAKANVLVYHLKTLNDDKVAEIRQFWNSLR